MKKIKHFFLAISFLALCSYADAQNYTVSGSWNSNENGTYSYAGTCNGRPYYILSNYVLSYDGYGSWGIGDYSYSGSPCGGFVFYDYMNNSNSSTPPTSGWDGGVSVSIAAPKVDYSSSQFVESSANNGSISNSITITHNNFGGATFAGTNGENFVTSGKVTVGNVPAGLTASVIRNNSLSLTISLAGNATAHNNANDISNLSVLFKNSAFSNNNAAGTVNYNSNLSVNFIQVLNVGTGQTYTTIQSAVNAAGDYDVISLAAQTFTESGIDLSNKSISIIGQSPSQTIIQANSSPGAANNRLFKAIYSTYSASTTQYFEKLTIRNGNYTTSGYPDGGGAVKATNTNLSFKDCYFESNKATTVGGYFGNGGGAIQVQWCKLNIENCTFYDNKFDAYNYGDFMGGGAIAFIESYGLNIKNSTFASNNSGGKGGGAIFAQVSTYPVITAGISVVNSTFSGNSTAYNGGAYYGSNGNTSTVTFKNNIFYGNTDGGNGPDLYSESGVSYAISNCLIGNATNIGSLQGNFTNCITGQNPQLGSLADNGGNTKTFAIPSNSPANNAGVSGSDIPTADQRGVVIYGGTKDIGSYEYDPCPFPITPSVSISTSGAGVCDNASATFTSTSSTGGSSPIFQWKKNGVDAGSGSTITFLSNTLSNGDVITCVLTANNVCQTTTTANSNTIVVTVKPSPSVAQITNGISTITTASLCTLGSTYNYYNATPYGTWSSSNPSVASVAGRSLAAVVTPNTNGTTTLSYSLTATNGCVSTSSILLTVAQQATPNAITGLNVVCAGSTIALNCTTSNGIWSSPNNRGTINATTGVYTGANAGIGEATYTVTNAAGCNAYSTYAITVNPIPVVPTITYAPGTPNPQAGAPTGSFCVGKVFTIVGTPNVPLGVWSATGATSITSGGQVTINAVGIGSIKYTYTSAAGCSNSRTMSGNGFSCAARGISVSGEGLVVSGDFTMYPNPAKGFINLNVETLIGAGSIVVTDLYGKTVKTQNLSMGTNTVNIANLSKGMYFVSTITNEGKTTKKLVVE